MNEVLNAIDFTQFLRKKKAIYEDAKDIFDINILMTFVNAEKLFRKKVF